MDINKKLEDRVYREVCELLYEEAELLDDGKFEEWLELLTGDIVYEMPVRVTREKGAGQGFVDDVKHFEENRFSLEQRVHRLDTEYAWAEDPPSRTRHFVTNIRPLPSDEQDEVVIRSYLLLYRTRGDTPDYDILSAERKDVLRSVGGSWKIARRTIFVDQTTLDINNLSVFL